MNNTASSQKGKSSSNELTERAVCQELLLWQLAQSFIDMDQKLEAATAKDSIIKDKSSI